MIRVAVADRRCLISESITASLNTVQDFDAVEIVDESSGNCQQVLANVLRFRPNVVLLGALGDHQDVFSIAEELRSENPMLGVVVIANNLTQDLVESAMAHAISILPNNARLSHLMHALRGVAVGCPTIYPALFQSQTQTRSKLNDRERQVLRLTIRGYPIKAIASELFLAPGTVRNLTSNSIKKLDGRNRFDAARIAVANGWI